MMSSQPPTGPTKPPARWRDFAHTAALKLAVAIADGERATVQRQARPTATTLAARPVRQRFTFALLAAATVDVPVLPTSGYDASDGGLSIAAAVVGAKLILTLQLEGLEALENGAGRDARVVSGNAAIDHSIAFDDQGRAMLTLTDSADVRAGVAALTVSVLDDPAPTA